MIIANQLVFSERVRHHVCSLKCCTMQCFGGTNVRYELKSKELGCTTMFTVYYPPAAESGKVPVRVLSSCFRY